MSRVKLTLACYIYDRTLPLLLGKVQPEGIELNYLPLWVQETFSRMIKNREFEISEMSFGGYLESLNSPNPPFVAIPVFPSKMFRHRSIYINKNSGINDPKDLRGKRVGVPEWRQTAAIWIKGILNEYYGVPYDSVTYYVGPLENKEVSRRMAETDMLKVKQGIKIERLPQGKTLSEMLDKGEIDAVYSAQAPSSFLRGSNVKRLFENYRETEIEFYRKTEIYPIMHIIVIRRDIYEKYPWVAYNLYKAFEEAKNIAFNEIYNVSQFGVAYMFAPWIQNDFEIMRSISGDDFWPYGVSKNYKTIETFIRYSYEQGIIDKMYNPREIFAKETQDT
ncbi:ABC transporter substrate-binding protein [Sulfolobus tengchongensis]|uniref:ABC transporter substrate-binding protein n=1 Tax=Sulfolobus tengchongensis TaxID=207809 RepID=A0AAX4L1Y8_9CREN